MESIRNGGLNMIKVSKEELLTKLKENKLAHLKQYVAAYEAFHKDCIKELTRYLSECKKGKITTRITFDEPTCHEDEYNTVIEMLEMSVDTEVTISMGEFKSFVQDQWAWKQAFVMNATKYLK